MPDRLVLIKAAYVPDLNRQIMFGNIRTTYYTGNNSVIEVYFVVLAAF